MELLPFLAPLLALGLAALSLRSMRAGGAWLRADAITSGDRAKDDGVVVHEGRRVVLTVLEPVRLTARVALEIEITIPADETKARLSSAIVQRHREALERCARVMRLSLTGDTLTIHVGVEKKTAPARRVIEAACALAGALEQASIHDVDGEGAPGGAPVAVRALGG
jgi:hypothetical protein